MSKDQPNWVIPTFHIVNWLCRTLIALGLLGILGVLLLAVKTFDFNKFLNAIWNVPKMFYLVFIPPVLLVLGIILAICLSKLAKKYDIPRELKRFREK